MPVPAIFDRLRLPIIGAPLFIVSNPDLVIAQCKAGIVGSFPALNARPQSQLDEWIHQITEELAAHDRDHPDALSAPFAVNQIVHRSNDRFEEDMMTCAKWKVPIVITSLGARTELNDAVHGWGGITLHDIIDDRYAHKAVEKGADGLIAVAAGAGGHAGRWSPFALVQEIRKWFDGPLALVRRDRDRRRGAGGNRDGRRLRLYRLAIHRHAGSPSDATNISRHHRKRRGRHRHIGAVHRASAAITFAPRSLPPVSIPTTFLSPAPTP